MVHYSGDGGSDWIDTFLKICCKQKACFCLCETSGLLVTTAIIILCCYYYYYYCFCFHGPTLFTYEYKATPDNSSPHLLFVLWLVMRGMSLQTMARYVYVCMCVCARVSHKQGACVCVLVSCDIVHDLVMLYLHSQIVETVSHAFSETVFGSCKEMSSTCVYCVQNLLTALVSEWLMLPGLPFWIACLPSW